METGKTTRLAQKVYETKTEASACQGLLFGFSEKSASFFAPESDYPAFFFFSCFFFFFGKRETVRCTSK